MSSGTVAEQPTLWRSMPGWGITADLVPPELINARRLKTLRRLIALGVVVVVLCCAAGYYLAARDKSAASADLASVQSQTTLLEEQGRQYSAVISIEGSITAVQAQVAQVMAGDVDLVAFIGKLQNAMPKTMTINQESISIIAAGVADSSTTATGSGLDVSGLPRIGTVTLNGTGSTLDDLSTLVDRLTALPGVVDVLPLSNSASADGKSGTQFVLRMGLTTALLSHRFDVPAGTK